MQSRTGRLVNLLAVTVILSGASLLVAAKPAAAASNMVVYQCSGANCSCSGTHSATCDSTGCFCT
jgi:hypothetical protein